MFPMQHLKSDFSMILTDASDSDCKCWDELRQYLLNPIPTGLGHVTLIYGLILPMAGRNRVKGGHRGAKKMNLFTTEVS